MPTFPARVEKVRTLCSWWCMCTAVERSTDEEPDLIPKGSLVAQRKPVGLFTVDGVVRAGASVLG